MTPQNVARWIGWITGYIKANGETPRRDLTRIGIPQDRLDDVLAEAVHAGSVIRIRRGVYGLPEVPVELVVGTARGRPRSKCVGPVLEAEPKVRAKRRRLPSPEVTEIGRIDARILGRELERALEEALNVATAAGGIRSPAAWMPGAPPLSRLLGLVHHLSGRLRPGVATVANRLTTTPLASSVPSLRGPAIHSASIGRDSALGTLGQPEGGRFS